MVIVKHLTKLLDVLVLAVLPGELSHFNFGVISFNGFLQECLAGLFRRIEATNALRRTNVVDLMTNSLIPFSQRAKLQR